MRNGSDPNDPAVDHKIDHTLPAGTATSWHSGADVTADGDARSATPSQQKNPCEGRCCRHIAGVSEAEAPVGVEPTMADLQSAALATWLRSRSLPTSINRLPPISSVTLREIGAFGQAVLVALTWTVLPPNTAVPIQPKKSAAGPWFLHSVPTVPAIYSGQPSGWGLLRLPTIAKPGRNRQSLAQGQKDRYSLGFMNHPTRTAQLT